MELSRGAEPLLHRLLDTAKVVIVEGGRGVGKTTLTRRIAHDRGFQTFFDLAEPADRLALTEDPHRVLSASPLPVFVDEAQLAPELTVAVKRVVDQRSEPGQVLLTGSARLGRGALGGGDPLAARAVRMRLNAFTQGELAGTPINVVDNWWAGRMESPVHPALDLPDLHQRMMVGGLPALAIGHPETPTTNDIRQRVLSAYVEGVLTMQLAGSRTDRARVMQTFRYLAANPGQILNVSRAASELSMRAETVQSYLDLCQSVFLLDIAPALRPSQHKTVTSHPRVFASDIALAAWAAATSPQQLIRDTKLSGALLENFVAREVAAQADWSDSPSEVLHWRDSRATKEVDLVLRRSNGKLLGIEVKSSASVSTGDARGLVALRESAGARFERGFIVYTGRVTQQLDEDLWAVPLSAFFES